jgi:hypothetical protein
MAELWFAFFYVPAHPPYQVIAVVLALVTVLTVLVRLTEGPIRDPLGPRPLWQKIPALYLFILALAVTAALAGDTTMAWTLTNGVFNGVLTSAIFAVVTTPLWGGWLGYCRYKHRGPYLTP